MGDLFDLLHMQKVIQEETFNHHFQKMTHQEKVSFIREMVLATTHELHEAMDETGWKYWSTADHFYQNRYMSELVDALLMLLNLFLVTGMYPDDIADLVLDQAQMKQKLNIQRQESGY